MTSRSPKATEGQSPLVRKQFLLTPEQSARLRAHALASGVTETDIVRAGIDLALQRSEADDDAWKSAWSQAAGVWADRDDLEAFYEERRRSRAARRHRLAGSSA